MNEKRESDTTGAVDEVVLAMKNSHQVIMIAVTTLLGLVLGFFAPRVIGWALGIGGLPFEKPMQLLQRISDAGWSWVLIVLGGVAGVVVGLVLLGGVVGAKITARDITIIKGSDKTRFARSQVALALFDDGHLVLRDAQDVDLIRVKLDVGIADVTAALRRYDWPLEE